MHWEEIFCGALMSALEKSKTLNLNDETGSLLSLYVPNGHAVAIKSIHHGDSLWYRIVEQQVSQLPEEVYWLKEKVQIHISPLAQTFSETQEYQTNMHALFNLSLQHLVYEQLYPGFILPSRFIVFYNNKYPDNPIFAQIQDLIVDKKFLEINKINEYCPKTIDQLHVLAKYIRLGYKKYQLLPDPKMGLRVNKNIALDNNGNVIMIDSNYIYPASDEELREFNQAFKMWK
jgi:hypothetical protein